MLTGLEIPIIAAVTGKAIATFTFSRTSVLIDQTRDILNDDHLTKSLILLYELNPKLASESDDRHKRARAIFNGLDLMKGPKYILIRHISARNAKSLAARYRNVVTTETTDAKIKQAREKARKREQMNHSKDITQKINTRVSGQDHAVVSQFPFFLPIELN
ncbi:hypothetical protein F5879DRAFT_418718 [Lentinula edodes]|nr:hypothetical protein F5879DRAFT_418718 [Lentinula edodes]